MAELHVFEYGGTAFSTFWKTCLNVEDFYVKTIGWVGRGGGGGEREREIMILTTKHGQVGYFHVTD